MEPSGVIDSGRPSLHRPRAFRASVPALVAILVLGCSPVASSPPATSLASLVDPSEGPLASAEATAAPALFQVVGTDPVIPRNTFPNRPANLPGAVAVDAGTYHAWVIAFAQVPGTQEIHHLTSPDAVTWTERADDSLEALSDGFGRPGAFPMSVLADGDGWVMYLTGTIGPQREGSAIWRATAPDPDGPWTRSAEPVLERGPSGAWDAGGLDFPSVIATDDGYVMVFSAFDPIHPDAGSIGLATSPDGLAWTKHDDPATTEPRRAQSDPVIEPGLCGGFDARAVQEPRPVAMGDRLVMVYVGYAGAIDSRGDMGFAEGIDAGRTWRCGSASPALGTEGLPDGFVHTVVVFPRADRVAVLVEWFSDRGTDLYLAEAPATLP